jgi:hypothetical protein
MAFNIRTSTQTIKPDLEILVNAVNVDVAPTVVLDASSVAPDPTTGELVLVAGTILSKNANNQYERFDAGVGQVIRGILAHTVKFPDNTAKSDTPAAMWNHGQWFRSDRIVGWATHQAALKAALPTCKFDSAVVGAG